MKKLQFSKLNWEERFVYLKNVPFDEKALNQKGAKFQIVRFLPKTSIEPHFHKKVYEIFYVRSGTGTVILNGQHNIAQKDDMFLCEPNDVHEIVNDSSEEFVILIFKTNEDPADIFWVNEADKNKYKK